MKRKMRNKKREAHKNLCSSSFCRVCYTHTHDSVHRFCNLIVALLQNLLAFLSTFVMLSVENSFRRFSTPFSAFHRNAPVVAHNALHSCSFFLPLLSLIHNKKKRINSIHAFVSTDVWVSDDFFVVLN